MLIKKKWNINNKHNRFLGMQYLHVTISYCILQCFHPIIPASTSKKIQLVFLTNHAIFTFIIVRLHFATLSPCNTCIIFPNSSLVFLIHYAIPTSIIMKLHFVTLPLRNTHIGFPNSSLVFLFDYVIPTYWS